MGNRKPLFNILQDEQKHVTSISIIRILIFTFIVMKNRSHLYFYNFFVDNGETDSIIVESQKMSIKDDNTIEIINHNAGHWLDSMLDSDE